MKFGASILVVLLTSCSTKQETKTIMGTPMIDVAAFGYEVSVIINNEEVYSGANTSYSGILLKDIKPGKNLMLVAYRAIDNPEAPSLTSLKVTIRHIPPDEQTSRELIKWEALDPQGKVNFEFELPSWELGVVSEPTAEDLLAIYDKALGAMVAGDVEAFKKLRDSEEIAKTEKIQAYQGKTLDSERLKSLAQYWHDWKVYQQTGLVKSPNWIRIDFQRDSPERDTTNKPRIEFLLILFKKEDDGWKLSRMARISNPKYTDEGQLATLTEADIPAPVRVPPQE